MYKSFKVKGDNEKTPIEDTKFFAWLESQSVNDNSDFANVFNDYLTANDFNPIHERVKHKTLGFCATVFGYFCSLNKIYLDNNKTYFLVENGSLSKYSTFRFTNNSDSVDYSASLYNHWGKYDLGLAVYFALHNKEARKERRELKSINRCNEVYFVSAYSEKEFNLAYDKKKRSEYLASAKKTSAEAYNEMLNVLPPENWKFELFEHFRMCEYETGTITKQFAKLGDKCISKYIDVTDKSTWITLDDFNVI